MRKAMGMGAVGWFAISLLCFLSSFLTQLRVTEGEEEGGCGAGMLRTTESRNMEAEERKGFMEAKEQKRRRTEKN